MLKSLLVALSVLTNYAFASDVESQFVSPWDPSAHISLTLTGLDYNSGAVIHYISGKKTIRFILSQATDKTCVEGRDSSLSTLSIGGQAIQVSAHCFVDSATDTYRLVTPRTPAGLDYIVNALKVAPEYIVVNIQNVSYKISAVNFSTVWNSLSDTAL